MADLTRGLVALYKGAVRTEGIAHVHPHHAAVVRLGIPGGFAVLADHHAKTLYITPGSPWENPFIESFSDKFCDECLNMHVFVAGRHAQTVVEAWRREYNDRTAV